MGNVRPKKILVITSGFHQWRARQQFQRVIENFNLTGETTVQMFDTEEALEQMKTMTRKSSLRCPSKATINDKLHSDIWNDILFMRNGPGKWRGWQRRFQHRWYVEYMSVREFSALSLSFLPGFKDKIAKLLNR